MSSRPAQEVFFEDFEGDPCLLCGRPAEDLAERPWKLVDGSEGIDHACDSCLAALEVAHGLMDNEVKDENEIITTIALAADAGLSWAETANGWSDSTSQQYPELAFSRVVDGMPLFRMLPIVAEVVRYEGSPLPKEIGSQYLPELWRQKGWRPATSNSSPASASRLTIARPAA